MNHNDVENILIKRTLLFHQVLEVFVRNRCSIEALKAYQSDPNIFKYPFPHMIFACNINDQSSNSLISYEFDKKKLNL